jgi:hypothetical protein
MTILINAAAIALIAMTSPAQVTERPGYASIAPYRDGTLIYAHYELAGMTFLQADRQPVTIIQADGSAKHYEVKRQGVAWAWELPAYMSPGTVTLFTCYPTYGTADRRWIAELVEIEEEHDDNRRH